MSQPPSITGKVGRGGATVVAPRPPRPDVRADLDAGIAAYQEGRHDEAERRLNRVLAADADNELALRLAGAVALHRGHPIEAVGLLRRAVELDGTTADAHNALGAAFLAVDRPDKAVVAFERAIAITPDYGDAYFNLGCAQQGLGNDREALSAYTKAVTLKPRSIEIYSNLAQLLLSLGHVDEAIACFRRGLDVDPFHLGALRGLGRAYRERHVLDKALRCFDMALKVDPEDADGHFARARTLLFMGQYEEGFEEYEWRWRLPDCPPRHYDRPLWDGRPQRNGTIRLHHEQGFGDTIQFLRYLPMVRQRFARVVVESPPALKRLLRNLEVDVVADGDDSDDFDVYAPLGSLARLFGTTIDSVPADFPYLRADPQLAAKWAKRIDGPGLRVGLAWAGNPRQPNDRNRSTTLEALAPLAAVEGVTFYGLQKGPGRRHVGGADGQAFPLVDLAPQIEDFADTAAAMANLDLVISVCTSVAHLAGALGRPAWTLLCHTPDWRWTLDRERSPWYPAMRLFRQPRRGDWAGLVDEVSPALDAFARRAR